VKFSIITATYNSALYLEETIESVLSQTYSDIEYIIVDGNSTDATHEIIKKFSGSISKLLIEDDESMYDAINKGIRISTGDVIAILNSDDQLASVDTIKTMADILCDKSVSGVYSNIINCYGKLQVKKKVFQVNLSDYLVSGKGTFVPHTSLYLKREVFDNVGLYSLDYKFASDFDFTIRVLKNYKIKHIDKYLFIFRRHDNSITASGKIRDERIQILDGQKVNYKFIKLRKLLLWSRYYIKNISFSSLFAYLYK